MAANRCVIGCLFVIAALIHCAAAQTRHVVGDSTGWTIPPSGPSTYSNWAATKSFRVGDTLVFNFVSGSHDVTTVTKAAFDACNPTSPVVPAIGTSPATITLDSEGEHYYFCSIGTHCSAGQKLAINVTGSTNSPPSTTTPPSAATPPTTTSVQPPTAGRTPSNSAPTGVVAGFSATLLSVAAALLV